VSDTSSIVIPAIAAVAGAALGTALSGYFTIRQKARSRVQKRRAEVYVDMLAWTGARLPELARKAETLTGIPARDARAGIPPPAGVISVPSSKTTFPDPAAGDLDLAKTAPGSAFFAALRARVVTFASHDMTRAFDRWTAQYKNVSEDLNARDTRNALHNLVIPAAEPGTASQARRFTLSFQRDPGRPDDTPGNMTRAIERCASAELRKG
jgi:hypothetical protein